MERREFTGQLVRGLFAFSFFDLFMGQSKRIPGLSVSDEELPILTQKLGGDLWTGRISALTWQSEMEKLYRKVDIDRIKARYDFDRLRKTAWVPFDGLAVSRLRTLRIKLDSGVVVQIQRNLFYADSGRAIVPHGHDNVVSLTMSLLGKGHVMHYDRLDERPEGVIIAPTIDRIFGPGDLSTISSAKDNIHWFKTISRETAVYLNLNMSYFGDSIPHAFVSSRRYVDVKGQSLGGGKVLAKWVDEKTAHRLYNSLS